MQALAGDVVILYYAQLYNMTHNNQVTTLQQQFEWCPDATHLFSEVPNMAFLQMKAWINIELANIVDLVKVVNKRSR